MAKDRSFGDRGTGYTPRTKKEFGMYHDNQWYSLEFKLKIKNNDFLENLDINILNNYCLMPHLNIQCLILRR